MIDPFNHVISRSVLAGISIGIGCILFSYCGNNVVLGSLLFSLGFLFCTLFNLNLFTDKSCTCADFQDLRRLVLVLILNTFTAFCFGLISRILDHSIEVTSNMIVAAHVESSLLQCIIKSLIAGFLIAAAVKLCYKSNNINYLVFILCIVGIAASSCFHCISDAFYYGASSVMYDNVGSVILRLFIVILFNFIGCNLYNLIVDKSFIHRSE